MDPFHPISLGTVMLRNRIVRSATYEGMCDENGFPGDEYASHYETLAGNGMGAMITGFAYIRKDGRAMQPCQAGIDSEEKIPAFRKMTSKVHRFGCPVFLQLVYTGRQSLSTVTGSPIRGVSSKPSAYFREKPLPLTREEIEEIIRDYARAAEYAQSAGFDGVQLHAAHGYLPHQFLLPHINTRKDEYGMDPLTGIGSAFLGKIIHAVRQRCGDRFPVIVKISGGVARESQFTRQQFEALILSLDTWSVDAIEISFGTMDYAFNIFRGDVPENLILSQNPLFKASGKIKRSYHKALIRLFYKPMHRPFSPAYNLEYARIAKRLTRIPIISVGGFRNLNEIRKAISEGSTDLVAMSRPFIAEPDILKKMKNQESYASRCINCNFCAVMCDTPHPTKCYHQP